MLNTPQIDHMHPEAMTPDGVICCCLLDHLLTSGWIDEDVLILNVVRRHRASVDDCIANLKALVEGCIVQCIPRLGDCSRVRIAPEAP